MERKSIFKTKYIYIYKKKQLFKFYKKEEKKNNL